MGLLDINVNSTTRLPLEPIKDASGKHLYEGCIPAVVTDITVEYQKYEQGEFAGKEVPVLRIDFANFKLRADEPDRFATLFIKPVGTKQKIEGTTDQYEDRKAEDVLENILNNWKTTKHFLESLHGSPNYRDITKISKEDQLKYFDLPEQGSPKDRLSKYESHFKYIESFVKGDGNQLKSMIIDSNNKPLNLWVKLLPNYPTKRFYSFPTYVGTGIFEPMKLNNNLPVPPKIIKTKPGDLDLNVGAKPAMGTPHSSSSGNDLPDNVRALIEGR